MIKWNIKYLVLPLQKCLICEEKYALNLDDNIEAHIKQGEALNPFCVLLQGLSTL